MVVPKAAPDPQDWLAATIRTQAEMQRDVLEILKAADARIKVQLKELLGRPTLGVGALVRQEQLKLAQRNLRREMAKIWAQLGDKIQARRLEAAARSIKVGEDLNKYLLGAVGDRQDAENLAAQIAAAEEEAARTGIDRMIARAQGTSYVPLSTRVYQSSIAINGTVDRLINTALVRGLSARELAGEVIGFIDPNTPGGARYASMRLARTEINNAAHAVAVQHAQDSPWIEGMQWRLSGSHPKPDICDTLAHGGLKNDGVYGKTSVPAKPHPQCFCYVTPVTPSDDDFLDALVGGKYNDYLKRYMPTEGIAKTGETVVKEHVELKPKTAKAASKKAAPPIAPRQLTAKARVQALYGTRLKFSAELEEGSAEIISEGLDQIPDASKRVMLRHMEEGPPTAGIYVGAGSVVDSGSPHFAKLANVQPRGWPAGKTWRDVAGGHSVAPRELALSDMHIVSRDLAHARETAMHESGHMLDDALGHLSLEPGWEIPMNALARDRISVNGYFDPKFNPNGWQSESFAQSVMSWSKTLGKPEVERIKTLSADLGTRSLSAELELLSRGGTVFDIPNVEKRNIIINLQKLLKFLDEKIPR